MHSDWSRLFLFVMLKICNRDILYYRNRLFIYITVQRQKDTSRYRYIYSTDIGGIVQRFYASMDPKVRFFRYRARQKPTNVMIPINTQSAE